MEMVVSNPCTTVLGMLFFDGNVFGSYCICGPGAACTLLDMRGCPNLITVDSEWV